MNWYSTVVPTNELAPLLDRIRSAGGTIAACQPGKDGVRVTWTTTSSTDDIVLDNGG
jgi:hypothetical protein